MDIDWSKPIQTKTGCPARLLGEINGNQGNFVVAVSGEQGHEFLRQYYSNGRYYRGGVSVVDLENVPPPKRYMWQNLYPISFGDRYNSRELADKNAREDRIAVLKLEIVDGLAVSVEVEPM